MLTTIIIILASVHLGPPLAAGETLPALWSLRHPHAAGGERDTAVNVYCSTVKPVYNSDHLWTEGKIDLRREVVSFQWSE